MTDGPKCATCGQTLVAGNPVVRAQHRDDTDPKWFHTACARWLTPPVDEQDLDVQRGRLVIETTYRLSEAR